MGRKYLGKHLCIITNNKNASKSNNGVIIIAHGDQTKSGLTFTPDGGIIYFYCPDGDRVRTNDYAFLKEWAGNNWYSRIIADGNRQCDDYWLTKSISYHASKAARQLGKRKINKMVRNDPGEAEDENRTNYAAIEQLVTSGQCPYDVLSIRHRRLYDNLVLLSDVVNKLKEEAYAYGEIHCCFCRAGKNSRPWSVKNDAYAT